MPPSSWLEHAPFAFWLIMMAKPRVIVELGTHAGYSYFAFCQAVRDMGLQTKCYAIDTWKGDIHSGSYGEDVFQRVVEHNNEYYSSFSNLIRSSFDQATMLFSPATIDLLHIDGQHFYDDVRHDFRNWQRHLSDRAIVLFHDTNVHHQGFGVARFWKELRVDYPGFEFLHCHGLGVLGYGSDLPKALRSLFDAESNQAQEIRNAYACLGSRITAQYEERKWERTASDLDKSVKGYDQQVTNLVAQLRAKTAAVSKLDIKINKLKTRLDSRNEKLNHFRKSKRWYIAGMRAVFGGSRVLFARLNATLKRPFE